VTRWAAGGGASLLLAPMAMPMRDWSVAEPRRWCRIWVKAIFTVCRCPSARLMAAFGMWCHGTRAAPRVCSPSASSPSSVHRTTERPPPDCALPPLCGRVHVACPRCAGPRLASVGRARGECATPRPPWHSRPSRGAGVSARDANCCHRVPSPPARNCSTRIITFHHTTFRGGGGGGLQGPSPAPPHPPPPPRRRGGGGPWRIGASPARPHCRSRFGYAPTPSQRNGARAAVRRPPPPPRPALALHHGIAACAMTA
jgi:hypothetical protein